MAQTEVCRCGHDHGKHKSGNACTFAQCSCKAFKKISEITEKIAEATAREAMIANRADPNLMAKVQSEYKKKPKEEIVNSVETTSRKSEHWDEREKLKTEFNNLREQDFVQDKDEKLFEIVEKMLRLDPDDLEAWMLKAQYFGFREKWQDAIFCWEIILLHEPNNMTALRELGGLHGIELEKYDLGLEFIEKVLSIDENNILALNYKAYMLLNTKKHEDAIEIYDKVIRLEPENENALTNRVFGLRWSEKYDEAIDEGRKVLKKFPNDISTIINLGESLEKKGKYTDAIQAYKTVLNIEKNHVNSIAKIGKCYEKLEEYDEAITWYKRGFDVDPDYERNEFEFRIGFCFSMKGQHNLAEKYYEFAANRTSENPQPATLHNLGLAKTELGKNDEAKILYEKSLEIDPNADNTIMHLGDWYYEHEEYEKAIEYFSRGVNTFFELESYSPLPIREPVNVLDDFYFKIGNCQEALGDYDAALENYDAARKLDPKWWGYWDRTGDIYFKQGNFKKAIEYHLKSLEICKEKQMHDQINSAKVNLGMAYSDNREYEKAIEQFDFVINDNSSSVYSALIEKGGTFRKMADDLEYNKKNSEDIKKYLLDAIDCFKKSIEIGTEDWPWLAMGYCWENIDPPNYENAIQCFEKAIEINNENGLTWSDKAGVERVLGQYNMAINSFSVAQELGAGNHELYYFKGRTYFSLGKYIEARNCFQNAFHLFFGDSIENVFERFFDMEETTEADDITKEIIENKQGNRLLQIVYWLGCSVHEDWRKTNDFVLSCFKFCEIVEGTRDEPDGGAMVDFLNAIGLEYTKKGESDLALEYHKKASDIEEITVVDKCIVLLNIGKVYRYGKNDLASCVKYYESAHELDPDDRRIVVDLIMIHKDLGNREKEKKYRDKLDDLDKE